MTGYVPGAPGTSSGPPSGWYNDPGGAPALRWWDGRQWTAHARPYDPPAPAGQEPGGRHRGPASAHGSGASWLGDAPAGPSSGITPASRSRAPERARPQEHQPHRPSVRRPPPPARPREAVTESSQPEIRGNRGIRKGTSIFRYFNAACYLVTGLIILGLQAKTGWDFKLTLFGIAAIAYSGWVGLTKRSYWYGGISYTIPILAIIFAFFEATQ